MNENKPVGLTRNRDWEVSVRRTRPVTPEAIWTALVSAKGRALWLRIGEDEAFESFVANQAFHWGEHAVFPLSVVPNFRIRLIWHSDLLDYPTVVLASVVPAKRGTTLSLHQERLRSAEQREQMRTHWLEVVDGIFEIIENDEG